ncbi:hypothetical protein BKA93DRAFT_211426 [Sparassis latifolia]
MTSVAFCVSCACDSGLGHSTRARILCCFKSGFVRGFLCATLIYNDLDRFRQPCNHGMRAHETCALTVHGFMVSPRYVNNCYHATITPVEYAGEETLQRAQLQVGGDCRERRDTKPICARTWCTNSSYSMPAKNGAAIVCGNHVTRCKKIKRRVRRTAAASINPPSCFPVSHHPPGFLVLPYDFPGLVGRPYALSSLSFTFI